MGIKDMSKNKKDEMGYKIACFFCLICPIIFVRLVAAKVKYGMVDIILTIMVIAMIVINFMALFFLKKNDKKDIDTFFIVISFIGIINTFGINIVDIIDSDKMVSIVYALIAFAPAIVAVFKLVINREETKEIDNEALKKQIKEELKAEIRNEIKQEIIRERNEKIIIIIRRSNKKRRK